MQIIWFSEIKWSYLKTRKQQILSRFPKNDRIYFIEPIASSSKNHLLFKNFKPVYPVTIPQIRSTEKKYIKLLLNFLFIRKLISILSSIWLLILLKKYNIHPDVIITSNVYWIDSIILLRKKYKSIRLVYDCNDDPLSFPNTPKYKESYFYATIASADKIIFPHNSYRKIVSQKYKKKFMIIPNGVDCKLFQKTVIIAKPLLNIKSPIVMYIGALSEWFDYDLVKQLAINIPKITIVLIGPVSRDASQTLIHLTNFNNIIHLSKIPHHQLPQYLKAADVCIIPFLKNKLTSHVLPNKLFEYFSAGKTCVMTNFNKYLYEYSPFVYIAETNREFIFKVKNALQKPMDPNKLIKFALRYDWNSISKEYRYFLKSITH
jgi:hypothetical protein